MNREQFIRYCFIALLIFIVYQAGLIFSPFIQTIFWAGILTFAFYPIYDFLRHKVFKQDTPAALTTTFIIFLIVVIPLSFLAVSLTSQAVDLYQFASDYVRHGRLQKLIDQIRDLHFLENLKSQSGDFWNVIRDDASAWLLKSTKSLGNFIASYLALVTRNIFFIIANIFLMLILIFIFLIDGEKIYSFLYRSAPLAERNKKPLFNLITDTFAAVIRGQLLTAVSQAVVAGITFASLGIPLWILFAFAIFFTSMIPILGAASIWVPLCIYLLLAGHKIKALILLLVGVVIISMMDNLIKPGVIGEKTKLPYFLLFFGILGGMKIYGFMGIFLAPVVLSLFFSLVRIYQEKDW